MSAVVWAGQALSAPPVPEFGQDRGRASFGFSYCIEQKRPKGGLENAERATVEGDARLHVARYYGVWARARGSGPWDDRDSAWGLTDLEFGPYARSDGKWGRLDLDGRLTAAAPAGEAPGDDIWYRGMRAWSFGADAKAAAMVLGDRGPTPVWLGLEVGYRGNGRSDWVYLPHHSAAFVDSSGWSKGGVFTWEAGLELRGKRAVLSTSLLWEEPLGASQIMAGKERPFYLIQRATVGIRKSICLTLDGEILLSGDDPATSFTTVSVAPRWSAGFGLAWGYPL